MVNDLKNDDYDKLDELRSIDELKAICDKIKDNKHPLYDKAWKDYADKNSISISEGDAKSYANYLSAYHQWHNTESEKQNNNSNGENNRNTQNNGQTGKNDIDSLSPEQQDWLTKKQANYEYSDFDHVSTKNLNDEYNVFNSWLQKEENGGKPYEELSDEDRQSKVSEFSKEFNQWLENNGYRSFYELSQVELMYALAEYKVQLDKDRTKENDDNTLHISENRNQVSQNSNENDDKGSNSGQSSNSDENSNSDNNNKKEADWIKKKRQSWKEWCEDDSVHNPNYIYDEQPSSGLKFDVYKTDKDKEEGNKAASIEYKSPKDVVIDNTDSNVPDYEFFAKLTRDAKEHDGVPGVTFKGEMTPEFQARLAASCIENGLKMVGGPDNIDINLLGNVSEELKQKVTKYNTIMQAQSRTRGKVKAQNTPEDSASATQQDGIENTQNQTEAKSSKHSVDPAVLAEAKKRKMQQTQG